MSRKFFTLRSISDSGELHSGIARGEEIILERHLAGRSFHETEEHGLFTGSKQQSDRKKGSSG